MSMASEESYPWKRFWWPWEKSISFADDGFVFDPESKYGILINPALITLETVTASPCVILLGEPGLGKSDALREHQAKLASHSDVPTPQVMFIDLKDFGSDAALSRDVFDSEAMQSWKRGNSHLYLLLDSFDEGLLSIEALSGYLVREIRKLLAAPTFQAARMTGGGPVMPANAPSQPGVDKSSATLVQQAPPLNRLHIRIACRPAVWPASLSTDLGAIFGEDVLKLRLVPLRRCDVEIAACQK